MAATQPFGISCKGGLNTNLNQIELIEIAPGIDLERDIVDQMKFEPIISSDLKIFMA